MATTADGNYLQRQTRDGPNLRPCPPPICDDKIIVAHGRPHPRRRCPPGRPGHAPSQKLAIASRTNVENVPGRLLSPRSDVRLRLNGPADSTGQGGIGKGPPPPPAVLLESFARISNSRWGALASLGTHRGSFLPKGERRPPPLQAIALPASQLCTSHTEYYKAQVALCRRGSGLFGVWPSLWWFAVGRPEAVKRRSRRWARGVVFSLWAGTAGWPLALPLIIL